MTKELILHNQLKDVPQRPLQVRKAGLLPGVVYGPAFSARKVAVSYHDFVKVFREAGASQVIYIEMDSGKEPVLVHDIQVDPLTDHFSHVDFYRFKEGTKVRAVIPLEFQGVAPGVKDQGGVLFTNLREVEVEGFPEKLVYSLVVDLSTLFDIGDEVCLRDLALPEGIEAVDPPDTVVMRVVEREDDSGGVLQEEGATEGNQAGSAEGSSES